jgi:hypothetical protein
MHALTLVAAISLDDLIGYVLVLLVFGLGLVVLWQILIGKIDISKLLEESGGGASMSRFQLLIFTFVIAFSLFMLVESQKKFPEVFSGVLTLLGISATTYGVSKGIQASGGLLPKGQTDPTTAAAAGAVAGAAAGAQTGAAAGAVAAAVAGAAGQSSRGDNGEGDGNPQAS